MEEIKTASDIRQHLENLKTGLEDNTQKQIQAQTKGLKADLDATVKALDILQVRMKSNHAQSPEKLTLKDQVGEALEKHSDEVGKFIGGDTGTPLKIQIETKATTLGASYTGGSAALNMQPTGIVNSVSRLWHVRDLLPQIPMEKGSLPIIKDNGVTGDGFGFVAEGALKPSLDFALAESPARAEVLAVIVQVSKQFLDDLGPNGVMAWITSKLTDLYLNAEDNALLNGTGVSPQIGGMNLAGNFTAATSLAADNDVIQLIKGLIQMRGLERNPSGIIINPTDLGRILLNQATGSGEFDLPGYVSVNANGGLSILNVPILDTVGQTAKRYNIIDNSQMVLGIRENLNIRFFEADVDNVQKNMITIRAEARIAFATYSAKNVIQGVFEA